MDSVSQNNLNIVQSRAKSPSFSAQTQSSLPKEKTDEFVSSKSKKENNNIIAKTFVAIGGLTLLGLAVYKRKDISDAFKNFFKSENILEKELDDGLKSATKEFENIENLDFIDAEAEAVQSRIENVIVDSKINSQKTETSKKVKLDKDLEEMLSDIEKNQGDVEKSVNNSRAKADLTAKAQAAEPTDPKNITRAKQTRLKPLPEVLEQFNAIKSMPNRTKKNDAEILKAGTKLLNNYKDELLKNGNYPKIAETLANINYKNGKPDAALNLLKEVVNTSTNTAQKTDVLEQMGAISSKLQKANDASSYYKQALLCRISTISKKLTEISSEENRTIRMQLLGELFDLNKELKAFSQRTLGNNIDIQETQKVINIINQNNSSEITIDLLQKISTSLSGSR